MKYRDAVEWIAREDVSSLDLGIVAGQQATRMLAAFHARKNADDIAVDVVVLRLKAHQQAHQQQKSR